MITNRVTWVFGSILVGLLSPVPPLPPYFVRVPGIGQGCWGATNWSGLVDPPVSPGLNPLHPDFPLPPLPHSTSIVFSHRTLRGERWEGKRDSWLAISSKDGATCTTWTDCHLINKKDCSVFAQRDVVHLINKRELTL